AGRRDVARAPACLRFPFGGGWGRLAYGQGTRWMADRYAHLSPGHLAAVVEKIVAVPAVSAPGAVEPGFNFAAVPSGARGEGEKQSVGYRGHWRGGVAEPG